MPYVTALDFHKVWWEDYAETAHRFEALLHCIAGGGTPRRIELLKFGGEESKKTV